MGSGQSTSGGPASSTGNWTFTLHFTPDAKNRGESPVYIPNQDLIAYFKNVDGSLDKLTKIWIYQYKIEEVTSNPVTENEHHFVLIESENWFWTFEKNSDGICVQRCKDKKPVRKEYRGKLRDPKTLNPTRVLSHISKRYTIQDIICWIYGTNKVNQGYDAIERNSQAFARELFEAIYRTGLN